MPRTFAALFVALSLLWTTPVRAQQTDALLHAPVAVLPVDSAPFQQLFDFDNDGDLDGVGTRVFRDPTTGQYEVSVWSNDNGAFSLAWQHVVAPIPTQENDPLSVAVGDWNDDGHTDFVVAGRMGTDRYLNQGDGTFQRQNVSLPALATHVRVVAGDFDADGVDDIAVNFNWGVGSNGSVLVYGSTSGLLSMVLTPNVPAHNTGTLMFVGEWNGLPGDELMVCVPSSWWARIMTINGNQLVNIHSWTLPLNYWGGWSVGDIDSDGDDDIMISQPNDGYVYRYDTVTGFTLEQLPGGINAQAFVDIDGDGDLDGISSIAGLWLYPGWQLLGFPSTFYVYRNEGNDVFTQAWTATGAGGRTLTDCVDIDGDGDLDLVAGRCIYYGQGPWDSEPPMPATGDPQALRQLRPHHVRDIDRDGDPDLLTDYINAGDGSMTERTIEVAAPPGYEHDGVDNGIHIDVDGDGAVDRIVWRHVAGDPNAFAGMVWLRNNGGGHFDDGGPVADPWLMIGYQFAWRPDHYLAGDCDGDGDQDLVANSDPNAGGDYSSQIFWNDNGWFRPGPTFDETEGGRIERIADLNGDGYQDLLMNSPTAGATWHRGTGNQNSPFVLAWTGLPLVYDPAALTLVDIDGDGRLDVVSVWGVDQIRILLNRIGTLSWNFETHSILLPGTFQLNNWNEDRLAIAAADFDGDDRTDIAIGPILGEPNVGFLLRQVALSTPPSPTDWHISRQVFEQGFAVDADGDGDPDVVGARTTRSLQFHGPSAGTRVQVYEGVAGENGATPVLGATGPFRAGELEIVRLTGVPGPTLAIFGIALSELSTPLHPLPSLSLWLDPATTIVGNWQITEDGLGRAAAMATLPIPLPNGLQGLTFSSQAFVLDNAAPQLLSQSNVLRTRIGS